MNERINSIQIFTVITCGEPDVPPGGYVVGYDFNIHSKIEFHCEPGYMLIGQSMLECNSQGEWNANPPTCQCKRSKNCEIILI